MKKVAEIFWKISAIVEIGCFAKVSKEEMEILNSQMNMKTLHTSLTSMCHYIITSGLVLKDGETIGFSAEQKWAISHSKSVYALSEYSLKIAII